MKKTFYILIMCMVVGYALPSCETTSVDDYPIMESFYKESVALPTVGLDSVKSFSNKVSGYVAQFPQAKQHRRYSLIQDNIKAASIRINLEIDTTWVGEDSIRF